MIEVTWKGEAHPEYDDWVREEISELQEGGLGCTDDLITHLIEVGNMETGPLIEVHGRDGKLYAEFIAKPEWVKLDRPH